MLPSRSCFLPGATASKVPTTRQKRAINNGDYATAYTQLRECYGYKDSAALLEDFYIYYDERTFTEYDMDGNVTLTGKFEYDQHGRRTLEISYDAIF